MPLLPVAKMRARIPFPFRNALHADIHEYIMYLYAYVCIYTNGNTGTYACEHIHIYMVLLKQTEVHKNGETEIRRHKRAAPFTVQTNKAPHLNKHPSSRKQTHEHTHTYRIP